MRNLLIKTALCASLALSPLVAQANECESLRQQERTLERQLENLLIRYPAVTIVLGLCLATGMKVYEETQDAAAATLAFGVCAGLGCTLTGVEYCRDAATEAFRLGLQKGLLESRIRGAC